MSDNYLALYRKYRPLQFTDVIGQDQLVTLLTSSIKQKKISHAYLFCGGRGTGKTTVARIFAREIGCNPEDIIEIDAASNRGIDEIRELREAVRTAPFSSAYKVYIIDEAHMLTKEAANALLKTLEEPPSHVVFILATTDPEKLPQTIISRCQKIVFAIPSLEILASRLEYVAHKEGKTLEKGASLIIARHGKGSYRDALGVLEQVLTLGLDSITEEHVFSVLGAPKTNEMLLILRAYASGDAGLLAEEIEKLKKQTLSAARAYDEFIELLRVLLLIRIGAQTSIDQDITRAAKEYATKVNSKTILALLERRHLLHVSDTHGWTAFTALLLDLQGEK